MAESGEEVNKDVELKIENEEEEIEMLQEQEAESLLEIAPEEDESNIKEVSEVLDTSEDVNNEAEEETTFDQGNEDLLDAEGAYLNEDGEGDGGDTIEGRDDDTGKDVEEEDEEEAEEEEEEELEEEKTEKKIVDPNVMPQVNVAVLAKRKWQVKVYPLKPADFTSGLIARVFKSARESLLYLMTGEFSRGKGEMYIQSVTESIRVVRSLMTLDSHFQEINIEVIRKNAEGVIQEKAYMRFDTKMVRMLFVAMTAGPLKNQGHLFGRKRERVIGSVFVKNLPPGTTKNMLRVMFPFAQEINYNPEKYTDGTARLVLKTRSTVIPCLKAFAKVELGGNILELHPLEKKKPPAAKDESGSRRRSSSQTVEKEGAKTEGSGSKSHADSKSSEDGKREPSKSKEQVSSKSGDKKEEKDSPKKRESSSASSKKEGDSKSPQAKGKERSASSQQRRPGFGNLKNRTGPYKKFPPTRDTFRRSKDTGGPKSFGDNRSGFRKPGLAGNRFGNRTGGPQRSQNFAGGSRSLGSGMRSGRGSRGTNDRRLSGSLNVGAELAAKAEATKDMMILQSQLNMAIKSQLAMLNQTQMAVEQAKRGASSVGLGGGLSMAGSSGVLGGSSYGMSQLAEQSRRDPVGDRGYGARSRSRDRGANMDDSANWAFGKRSAAQADLGDDYGDAGYVRKRSSGMRNRGGGGGRYGQQNRGMGQQSRALGQQGRAFGGANRSGSEAYDEDSYRHDSYALREQAEDPYSYGPTGRSFGGGASLDSSARSGNYDSEGYGAYRY
ncbi:nucleolin [Aplysia californica]|uniref:Nucleolin n=1 Tax=Aplysia californica TaxID=6500 RepID=A0ABM0K5J4_APLCA|nr:nucleolin [Aplysia californica]